MTGEPVTLSKVADKLSDEVINQLAQAEIARTTELARGARIEADTSQIHFDRERVKWAEELSDDKYNNVYFFGTSVSEQSTNACMKRLTIWDHINPTADIEIIFSSPGGSVIEGMALFDFILGMRAKGHKVTTSTIGYAASMAGILLQAGDVRKMGREAYILIHEISFGIGGKIGEVEDEVAFVKKIQSRVLDIFAERTTLTKRQLDRRWKRKDWWLDSDEALRLGFVDEVA